MWLYIYFYSPEVRKSYPDWIRIFVKRIGFSLFDRKLRTRLKKKYINWLCQWQISAIETQKSRWRSKGMNRGKWGKTRTKVSSLGVTREINQNYYNLSSSSKSCVHLFDWVKKNHKFKCKNSRKFLLILIDQSKSDRISTRRRREVYKCGQGVPRGKSGIVLESGKDRGERERELKRKNCSCFLFNWVNS